MGATVQSLLRNEIANNWIIETGLSLAEAWEKLPLGIAVGKLNVVFAQGKEPCLVLDSVPRQHKVPFTRGDVALSTQPEDTPGAFAGASIDFKATLPLCHFGRFSAFWWQRTGAFVPSVWAVGLEAPQLFVDDLLCALVRDSALEMFAFGSVLLRNCCARFMEKGAVPGQPHLVWLGDQLLPRYHSARVR